MTKHTPGPWTAESFAMMSGGREVTGMTIKTGDDSICDLNSGEGWPEDELQANARLIAAAPELLDVLVSICFTWECNEPQNAQQYFGEKVKSILQKANGE